MVSALALGLLSIALMSGIAVVNNELSSFTLPAMDAIIASKWDSEVFAKHFDASIADQVKEHLELSKAEVLALNVRNCQDTDVRAIGWTNGIQYIKGSIDCRSIQGQLVFDTTIIQSDKGWKFHSLFIR